MAVRPTWFALVCAALLLCSCGRHPNVLLITFDTTRADAVGFAAHRTNVTPTLDGLAANGVWFSDCITSAPLTMPAHSTIMTGLYPFHHGVRNNGTYVLDRKNVTLAKMLHDDGYATHAVVSAFVLDRQFGLDQGFDAYDDDLSGSPMQKMFMFREIKANQTADKAIAWLKGGRPQKKPFFLWLHFFDPHADYEPPKEFADRFPGEKYEGEVAFADQQLGRVLQTLADLGLRDDTLIVMTADHGESLGDHGERTHGIFAYQSTMHVPLIISGKAVPAGRRVDALVRTADIAPTLIEMLHLPRRNVDGASLVDLIHGRSEPPRTAYSESFGPRLNFGWSEERTEQTLTTKYISAPRPEIYDLKNDPEELRNLYAPGASVPSPARPLIADLQKIVSADPFSHGGQRESNMNSETRRKLSALGYVWGSAGAPSISRADPKDRVVYWDRFEDAQAAIRNHQYGPALEMIRSILAVDRDNVIAMASLANVLMRINQRAEALALFKRMIELDPARDTPYLGASRILREAGRFQEAESYARTVIRMEPRNPEGYTAVGDVMLDQNRFGEAEALFGQAIAIDPHSSLAISGLGNCLNRAGRLREALRVLRDGHEHDPTSEVITYNLAVVVERLGDPDGAKKLYEDTVKEDPDHSMAWNNLGAIDDRAGQTDEAIRCVIRARQADPTNVEAAYNLGVLLERVNKPADALPNFEDTLRLRPDFVPAAVQRAQVLATLKRTPEALAAWKQLTAAHPAAWLQVALLELDLGHDREARDAVREGLNRGGEQFREAARRDERLRLLIPKSAKGS